MDREWNDVERLAFAQALYKMAAELVSTKDPDSLRSIVDEGYRQLYEQTGSKSFDIMLNGQQVGTYSIRFSKPKEEETSFEFVVNDFELLGRWFDHSNMQIVAHYVAINLEKYAEWYFTETGEVPPGCDLKKTVTPAIEKQYIGGVLKIDSNQVKEAVSELLPQTVVGLLGGSNE